MIFGNEYQSSTAQRMFPQPGNLWFTLVFGIQLVDVPNEVMKKFGSLWKINCYILVILNQLTLFHVTCKNHLV